MKTYNGKTLHKVEIAARKRAESLGWIVDQRLVDVITESVIDSVIPRMTISDHSLEEIYDEAALSVEDGNPLLEHKRGLEAVATAVAHATVEMIEGKK